MDPTKEIQKLHRKKRRLEQRLKELDKKIDHIIYCLHEERRCMTRNCPLDELVEQSDISYR